MFDPTFTQKTLSAQLLPTHYKNNPALRTEAGKTSLLRSAEDQVRSGISRVNLGTESLKGKDIYRFLDLEQEIIARKANHNLIKISRARQNDRDKIVGSISRLCEEGVAFNVFKFDIKGFYESIDTEALSKTTQEKFFTNPSTHKVIKEILTSCNKQGVSGLPRGMAISASLSEIYMDKFDKTISKYLGIHFYARYVDDILIIADPTKSVKSINRLIAKSLPKGLQLNTKKTKILRLYPHSRTQNNGDKIVFDYLGYELSIGTVIKQKWVREVKIDIAPKKIKKAKTRIVLSLRQFLRDGNFPDLYDRIRILTGSYEFKDRKTGRSKFGGFCHTHSRINTSDNLEKLDLFLQNILSGNTGKVMGPLSLTHITEAERRSIKKLSFRTGHQIKARFSIKNDRLISLMECWKYA